MVKGHKYRLTLCVLLSDVLCPLRVTQQQRKRFSVNSCCRKCSRFAQFNREMAEEDERMMDEIEEIRKHGYG